MILADPNELKAVIRKLRPISAGHELIRIGGDFDGGYLVPNCLDGISSCYSPGVGWHAKFEADLLQRFNINSHLADGTVTPLAVTPFLSFRHCNISSINSSSTMTLENWMKQTSATIDSGDLILQMDIEGSEYEVLLSTPVEILNRFRIILIEFHNVDAWASEQFLQLVKSCVDKLKSNFSILHLHQNNHPLNLPFKLMGVSVPRVFEATLLRNDWVKNQTPVISLPHPLDQPNLQNLEAPCIPEFWYKEI